MMQKAFHLLICLQKSSSVQPSVKILTANTGFVLRCNSPIHSNNGTQSENQLDRNASLSPSVKKAHELAVLRGEEFYIDPVTGYRVFTELAHRKRGHCCGNFCRHCPYNHEGAKKS